MTTPNALQVEYVAIGDLKPYEKNPRLIPDRAVVMDNIGNAAGGIDPGSAGRLREAEQRRDAAQGGVIDNSRGNFLRRLIRS